MAKRTTYCGNVSAEFIEKSCIKRMGSKRRDLGGLSLLIYVTVKESSSGL